MPNTCTQFNSIHNQIRAKEDSCRDRISNSFQDQSTRSTIHPQVSKQNSHILQLKQIRTRSKSPKHKQHHLHKSRPLEYRFSKKTHVSSIEPWNHLSPSTTPPRFLGQLTFKDEVIQKRQNLVHLSPSTTSPRFLGQLTFKDEVIQKRQNLVHLSLLQETANRAQLNVLVGDLQDLSV